MKFGKIAASAAALSLTCAAVYTSSAFETRNASAIPSIFGDINGDGAVDADDASLILSYYAYTSTTTDRPMLDLESFLDRQNGGNTDYPDYPDEPDYPDYPDEPDEPDRPSIDPDLRTDGDVFTILTWNMDDAVNLLKAWLPEQINEDDTIPSSGIAYVNKKVLDDDGYFYTVEKALKTPSGKSIRIEDFACGGGSAPEKIDRCIVEDWYDVDIFFMETDWACKFTDNSYYTIELSRLGITDEDASVFYKYADTLAKNSKGERRSLPLTITPGAFAYRADLAETYLGVTSPEQMQATIGDWDKFVSAASKIASKSGGRYALADSLGGLASAYFQSYGEPLVKGNTLYLGDDVKKFADISKELWLSGGITQNGQWTDKWTQNGDAIGYFIADWALYDNSFLSDAAKATNSMNKWEIIEGPTPFWWGGTNVAVCSKTDNADDAAAMLKTLCTQNAQDKFARCTTTIPNDKTVNALMDSSSLPPSYSIKVFGGRTDILKPFRNNANALCDIPTPSKYNNCNMSYYIYEDIKVYYIYQGRSWEYTQEKIRKTITSNNPDLK